MSNQTQIVSTFPVAGILGIAFVVLKLTGYIAWSWWWVLAPFWAPTAILIAAVVGMWLAVLVVTAIALCLRKRK